MSSTTTFKSPIEKKPKLFSPNYNQKLDSTSTGTGVKPALSTSASSQPSPLLLPSSISNTDATKNGNNGGSIHHLPSLSRPSYLTSQVSMIFTYKRIILPLLAPPFLSFVAPFALSKLILFFNVISNGCALGCFIVSSFIINMAYGQIGRYAPSLEKCNLAIASIRFRFELCVFTIVSYFLRHIMAWMNDTSDSNATIAATRSHDDGSFNYRYILQAQFLHVHFGIRIAMGLFTLSLLIASRFVGYFSIVQFPSFPLPTNPYQAILNNFASFISNFDQILKPDSQQQQQQQQQPSTHKLSKRYSKPTIPQILIQMTIHFVTGLIFGVIILPYISFDEITRNNNYENDKCNNDITSDLKHLFLISCALTCAFSFMSSYVTTSDNKESLSSRNRNNNNYHEISFDRKTTMPSITITSLWSVVYDETIGQIQTSSVLFYWITSPLAAATLIHLLKLNDSSHYLMVAFKNECPGTRQSLISTFMVSYVTTLIMCLYMITTDIFTRKFLTTRGLNILKLVSQSNVTMERVGNIGQNGSATTNSNNGDDNGINGGSYSDTCNEIDVEALVVSVILAGLGSDTIDDILCPRLVEKDGKIIRSMKKRRSGAGNSWVPSSTHSFANVDVEEEEVRRNNLMIKRVAASIVTGAIGGYSTFEEDLLKFMLLESIGGDSDSATQLTGQIQETSASLGLSACHHRSLIQYFNTMDQASGSLEVLSIVRALCAYAGGMGEALSLIFCHSRSDTFNATTKENFSLQPCVCLSGTHAIKAAAKFIILNMKNERARFNRLSLLIPVVLQAIFTLRCGVLDHAHYLFDNMDPILQSQQIVKGDNFGAFFSMKHPDMSKLVKTCDDYGMKILHSMKRIDGRNLEIAEIKVDENVKEWLDSFF